MRLLQRTHPIDKLAAMTATRRSRTEAAEFEAKHGDRSARDRRYLTVADELRQIADAIENDLQ